MDNINYEQEKFKIEKSNLEIEKSKLKLGVLQNKLKIIIIAIFIVFEILFFTWLAKENGMLQNKSINSSQIGIINFNKTITSKTVTETISLLDEAVKNESIKEILFIMNSPGGSPAASEELSEYLKEINKIKKVHMYIESMAASGGYYIASAIKPLQANKNAVVGSIGVILQHYNLEELSKKIGIEEDNIAYGEYKQPISLFRNIDEKSKEYLEEHLLSPMYNNFVNSVSENRGINKEEIEKLAQGKVFLANDPRVKNILIDEITNLYKVKEKIKSNYQGNIDFVVLEEKNNKIKDLLKGAIDLNITSDILENKTQLH